MATNRDVMAMLAELAKLTQLQEENPQSFKVRAYENAVHGLEGETRDISSLSVTELTKIKGVGKSTAAKIRELIDRGSVAKLEALRTEYPPSFVELTKIPGLGPKTLKRIRSELGVENLDDLKVAIANEALRDLPGLGATSEEKIGKAIERLGLHGKDRRTPIAEAMPVAERLVAEIRELDGVTNAEFGGSLRRHAETIGDIDITVAATAAEPVMRFVAAHSAANEVIAAGTTKTSILTRQGLQVDVRVVAPEEFGAATLYFTGSKAHNIALRQRAIDRGWLLNEYGLFDAETDDLVVRETEAEIYAALDMDVVAPPLREATGEVEAAAERSLPKLVALADIKGDLHYHTDRSGDGRSSLPEMVDAAAAHGYDYLAITDHGEDLAINGSSREEMLAHRAAIDAIQADYPDMRLLFGCELNISPAGDLDYDAAFRSAFEFTVASVHSHFDMSSEDQTVRILTAMADPSVNAIGHLTGRYIGRRPGIELDVDAVLEGLATTGVALEINGALDRLDAAADVLRRAVAKGVYMSISTDSHHTSELKRMEYGVLQSQRGWVPGDLVVNTWPCDRFMEWVMARR
ncbi:MAG: DNA polymerase/3'-5' exonuclease PolX [Acidimicrobiia bacterium]|nr:DNA polymerase/3'-5' exonuclease PolX [Acidimicrobiia bacterium]